MSKPLLIVLTPVFNEAWILPAFLKATSLWADYIIIADQMSTDGSREIYKEFEKVIVLDNPRKEMHQARTRQMLFEEAKKIPGNKILFTLDADEFLSGNFFNTESWNNILNSVPGDVFEFRWMNLREDATKFSTWQHYYWAVHIKDNNLEGMFPDNFIHEWRLPWPEHVNKEYIIDDISFIHFARVNVKRQSNKKRFYQISTVSKMNKYKGVIFYRAYHPLKDEVWYDLPENVYDYYQDNNVDINGMINLSDEGIHYTTNVLNYINEFGIKKFAKLDVWDKEFLQKNNLKDPRKWYHKILHSYLRLTNKYQKTIIIRGFDKILKILGC